MAMGLGTDPADAVAVAPASSSGDKGTGALWPPLNCNCSKANGGGASAAALLLWAATPWELIAPPEPTEICMVTSELTALPPLDQCRTRDYPGRGHMMVMVVSNPRPAAPYM